MFGGQDGVIEEDDSDFMIMADQIKKDGVPLSRAPKVQGLAAHVTPLFYILHQNIYIALTIEIL